MIESIFFVGTLLFLVGVVVFIAFVLRPEVGHDTVHSLTSSAQETMLFFKQNTLSWLKELTYWLLFLVFFCGLYVLITLLMLNVSDYELQQWKNSWWKFVAQVFCGIVALWGTNSARKRIKWLRRL